MGNIFGTVLNMSLTGAFIIAVICLARLPLKKAPKIFSYCLWAVAGFRLVFPFTIESVLSLIPRSISEIQSPPPRLFVDIYPPPSGTPEWSQWALSSERSFSVPVWSVVDTFVVIWLVGIAVMLVYGIVSYFRLKHKLRSAIRLEGNLYETDCISSPFVLGIIKPKIYLPLDLSGQEQGYIILHEQTHIKRCDHIVKFAAYFILCLHWFNPLAWVAFMLMSVDMEMSCDERVLKEMGAETKKDYSMSLLSLASKRRLISGSPLAFSEGGLKERIKRVLNFKKPSRVIVTAAIVLVVILSVGFAMNRANESNLESKTGGDEYLFSATVLEIQSDTVTVEIIAADTVDGNSLIGNGEKITFSREYLDEIVISVGDVIGILIKGHLWDSDPTYAVVSWSVRAYESQNTTAPVSIIIQSVTPNGITFLFENETSSRYTYGVAFTLYVFDENDWHPVDTLIEDWGFNEEGYYIEPQSTTDIITIDWQWLHGELPPGEYLIQKDVLYVREPGDFDKFVVDAYFTIFPDIVEYSYKPESQLTFSDVAILPQIMHNDTIYFYSADQQRYDVGFVITEETPRITSVVPPSQVPIENGQANFDDFDAPYVEFMDGVFVLRSGIWDYFIAERPLRSLGDTDILDNIYLGMGIAEVHDLFGEPDYHASGLMWFGYNDIGWFNPTSLDSFGVIDGIYLDNGTVWSVDEMISTAVKQHNKEKFYEPDGVYLTESHVILSLTGTPHGFTVYTMSLYLNFVPDGEDSVREVGGTHVPLALTFIKNASGEYELTEYWEPGNGENYMSSIRSKFPRELWDKVDTQLYIENSKQNCFLDAMFYFGRMIP